MKILWIVNMIFPFPNTQIGNKYKGYGGGWLLGLYNSIKKNSDIKLAIATTYNGKEFFKFEDNDTLYYLLPCKNSIKYDKKLEVYWKKINEEYNPEVVHIHGTEYAHGLAFQRACPNVKTVTSIQGLISICANNYIASINIIDIIKNITFRDIIKRNNILQEQKEFEKRGKNEIEIIKNSDAIIGRTEWDYANTLAIANKDKYYKCNETLRDAFYKNEWNINNIKRHSIFISQANYPIKGFHIMIKTINILRYMYPDLKVYVAGQNILDKSHLLLRIKKTGYSKYIETLIKKYKLENIIEFTGSLTEEQMVKIMKKSHVFVQTSSIENSPNSLGEAMILGLPCIASNVGGTSTMLIDKEEGFLYPFGDYGLLSYYIRNIFENDELATKFSNNSKKHAKITHNKETNVSTMIEIYKKISKQRK